MIATLGVLGHVGVAEVEKLDLLTVLKQSQHFPYQVKNKRHLVFYEK